jgi:hypothetical protein
MKLLKFRPLKNHKDLRRVKDIIENGFYCSDFLKFNDMNEGVFTINQINYDIDLLKKQQYKICSFSGENALNSHLMWGHYANAGMGIAIEVEVSGLKCNQINQVKYSNSTFDLNTTDEILMRKSEEWKYEDEFRYISKDTTADEVNIGNISIIYFGSPYINLVNYNEIKDKHKDLKITSRCVLISS